MKVVLSDLFKKQFKKLDRPIQKQIDIKIGHRRDVYE